MKQRTITALIIIAIIAPVLYFGGWALDVALSLVTVIAVYEIIQGVDKTIVWPGYVGLFFVVQVLSRCDVVNFVSYLGLFLVALFVLQILTKNSNINTISYLFLISILFSLALRAFNQIYHESFNLLLMVIISTYACDTGAYFAGTFFGKHKLIPEISPNKTVEGAIGGFIVSLLFSTVFSIFVLNLSLLKTIISATVIALAGQIGDLAFSTLKRKFHIKDFGTIFPGHGGILDRIDSLLFSLLVFHSVWELISRWNF